ncbi:hypothetical protein ESA94_17775 [Lacibacter luteus]|uniref:Uncharacterized protein n=1 Tax=Lacibacter luteus TaxID=2508719 RepID=A0A4Q1CF26_9BACT|nr:hypothetical protein [Lacibacter luteus]RXK58486.1 hypothetical protein ESA94_17775 [Lacibacter luteus]
MKQVRLIIFFLILGLFSKGQNDVFRTKVIVSEIGLVGGGVVVFPQTKDTIAMSDDGIVTVNLAAKENRLFYILWSGWKTQIFRFENGQCDSAVSTVMVPDTSFYQKFYDSKKCPICLRSKYVLPITYHLPTKKMFRKARNGKMYLGGCMVYDYSPHFYCKKDEFEF